MRRVLIVCALLSLSSPARAEEETLEVVVTAKKSPEDPFLSDRSITLIDRDTLHERSPRTVPEALWDTGSVFVQHTNYGGGSPIVRGMIGPQVLLMVDGVRFSNSVYRTGPVQYLNLLGAHAIERIEVLRGPGSVLYGSDAMGGVIQVFPARPRDFSQVEVGEQSVPRPSLSTAGAGGTLRLRQSTADNGRVLHGHFDAGSGGVAILGGGSFSDFGNLHGGEDVGEQIYSGYQSASAMGRAVYEIDEGLFEGWSLTSGYLFTRIDDAGRTDKLFDRKSLQLYDNIDHLIYGRVHFESYLSRTTGDLTFSYQYFFERKDNFSVEDDLRTPRKTTRDEVTAETPGVDIQFVTKLFRSEVELRYGGMFYRDRVSASREQKAFGDPFARMKDQAYPDGSSYHNYGIYFFGDWDVMRYVEHTIRIQGGYRLHGMGANAPEQTDLAAVDFSQVGHIFSTGVQYLYDVDANIALTFSQGFRAPNLQEAAMLGDTGKYFHLPNDSLKPERSDTFELNGRIRFWKIRASVAGYVSLLDDLIKRENTTYQGEATISGKDVAHNVNGGTGLIWGTEGRLDLDIGAGLSMTGQLAYTWGEEDLAGEAVPLTRIPPLFGTARVRYEKTVAQVWSGFFEAYVRMATKQERLSKEDEADARIPEGGTEGWWTLNLRAGAKMAEHVRLVLTIENLLNKTYRFHGSGVYSPGLNGIVSLEVSSL